MALSVFLPVIGQCWSVLVSVGLSWSVSTLSSPHSHPLWPGAEGLTGPPGQTEAAAGHLRLVRPAQAVLLGEVGQAGALHQLVRQQPGLGGQGGQH